VKCNLIGDKPDGIHVWAPAGTVLQVLALPIKDQAINNEPVVVHGLAHDDIRQAVGFYLADAPRRELWLGPYVGEATDHQRIGYGQGICGQAAQTRKTFLVQDVTQEGNYLACSQKVMAEIVVPVWKDNAFVGELDIDSHRQAPFTIEDQYLCEGVARVVAGLVQTLAVAGPA